VSGRTNTYSATVFLPAAATALGQPPHVSQVRVWGYGASWMDFVRRCVAAEVETTSPRAQNPYARASSNLRWSGGETGEQDKIRVATGFPRVLFVSPLDGPILGPGGARLWPFAGAYLLPDAEKSPKSYRLLRVPLTKIPTPENPIEVAVPGRPSPFGRAEREPDRVIGTVHREGSVWVARPARRGPALLAINGLDDALRALVAHDEQADAVAVPAGAVPFGGDRGCRA
jgi:hypothetical protein